MTHFGDGTTLVMVDDVESTDKSFVRSCVLLPRWIVHLIRILKLAKYRLKAQVEKDEGTSGEGQSPRVEKDEGPNGEG